MNTKVKAEEWLSPEIGVGSSVMLRGTHAGHAMHTGGATIFTVESRDATTARVSWVARSGVAGGLPHPDPKRAHSTRVHTLPIEGLVLYLL